MYIELFLLDNTLMNLLIFRLASALCSKPVRLLRAAPISLSGAVYAALSVSCFPLLGSMPLRIVLGLLMAFAIPCSSISDYFKNVLALLTAAFIAGGSTLALSCLLGGRAVNGALLAPVPLRAALVGAAVVFLFVTPVRNWIAKRCLHSNTLKLRLTHRKVIKEYTAVIDSGNSLTDPLTGLSAVILSDAELRPFVTRPIPCLTVGGTIMLDAFVPEKMELYAGTWQTIPVICALSAQNLKDAKALIGQSALPPNKEHKQYDC
ncbi:MAG: Sporulation factor SpoIIGA [Firmicutes bacterium ADurb.Bin182]|nr:MAG: Sporulation factor SpoIIGA [Firmicutes bacterium ADurb.Bin182]